ncbi:GNAT family N-acetyltransferase [Nocardioides mesophilus]|uniref:GNAT family N-acetyltransferase n=1 Tax=Nocardioides mesophilus TaxID=433659 RepID=A0A7G9RBE0_9ACTN|nr:GNAT family N-acetyltransferase [Nocardioides mesophilus]QNN52915.1 GNAT family N-acetyltransferase [Nocardioides mesophilus]
MGIEELRIDEPQAAAPVEEVVGLYNAVDAVDAPWSHPWTTTGLAGMLRHGWDGEPPRLFAVREAGRLVGAGELWTSEWDNTDLAWLGVSVHPDERRRGVGTALLARLLEEARACGRTKVGADAWDDPGLAAFAQGHGFERRSQAINRRQVLAEVDPELVEKLYAEARAAAAAYELVRVGGRTPAGMLDAVAELTAAINDAPTDDLDIEDEVFPPERVRGYEDAVLARGQRLYRLLARHRETGVLAGHTIVAVEGERPGLGHQHDTSVVRAHRGHRLGLLLKAGMVRWLHEAEPQLETVDTWNAESNDHMIAVNEQLGYRPIGRAVQYQRPL